MTNKTETVELNESELEQAQGAGIQLPPFGKTGNEAGIIVVDEDGLSGPSDQILRK